VAILANITISPGMAIFASAENPGAPRRARISAKKPAFSSRIPPIPRAMPPFRKTEGTLWRGVHTDSLDDDGQLPHAGLHKYLTKEPRKDRESLRMGKKLSNK